MPHRKKIEVFVVRRTNRKNPADTGLIFGGPRFTGQNNVEFVSSCKRSAKELVREMESMYGTTELYEVEPRSVRI